MNNHLLLKVSANNLNRNHLEEMLQIGCLYCVPELLWDNPQHQQWHLVPTCSKNVKNNQNKPNILRPVANVSRNWIVFEESLVC